MKQLTKLLFGFAVFLFITLNGNAEEEKKAPSKTMLKRKILQMFDKDGDGQLSAEEQATARKAKEERFGKFRKDRPVSEKEGEKPPLYIVSMMHAEEEPFFMKNKSQFIDHSGNLRKLVSVFSRHKAKVAVQPDWTFIEGAKKWDPELFKWLIDQGMGVDAHAHGTKVSIEEVAQKLKECGVRQVRVANGDFEKKRPEEANWVWPFAQPETAGKTSFEVLCAYKDVASQTVNTSRIIWRPATTGDWHVHDPSTPLLYVAGGPMGRLNFEDLKDAVKMALKNVKPGVVNVMYWHDSIHNYGAPGKAKKRIKQWNDILDTFFKPLVKAGKVKWATFSEMADVHLKLEQKGALALKKGEIVSQISSKSKYGNLHPVLRRLDRNKDGALDSKEFPGTETEFKKSDKDGDGFIKNDEFKLIKRQRK